MNLYEIQYTKEYIGDDFKPYKSKPRLYQVPSDNEYNALVNFGQIMNNEDYRINILYIHKVASI